MPAKVISDNSEKGQSQLLKLVLGSKSNSNSQLVDWLNLNPVCLSVKLVAANSTENVLPSLLVSHG